MKFGKRTISKVIIAIGILFIIFGVTAPFFVMNSENASVSIIGGADAPTYGYLFLRMWGGACFALVAIGVAMVAARALVLYFDRMLRE